MKKKLITSNSGGVPWTVPEVGMGATIHVGSDSYPGTVIQITRNGKRIVIQEDNSVRTDNNGLSEIQEYDYQPNPNGTIYIATLRKDGTYRLQGEKITVHIGNRRKYYDPSF